MIPPAVPQGAEDLEAVALAGYGVGGGGHFAGGAIHTRHDAVVCVTCRAIAAVSALRVRCDQQERSLAEILRRAQGMFETNGDPYYAEIANLARRASLVEAEGEKNDNPEHEPVDMGAWKLASEAFLAAEAELETLREALRELVDAATTLWHEGSVRPEEFRSTSAPKGISVVQGAADPTVTSDQGPRLDSEPGSLAALSSVASSVEAEGEKT